MMQKLLMGNQAFAHAALEAGVNVVAGYPGTPSSELVETVAALRAQGTARDVYVEWSTNEKSALEMAAGAAYCGARVLFTCKQVGLNVASDALMSLNYVGVNGATVLFVADDPGPISSQTEQDTRRFAAFAKVPVFDPATPEQGFAMMKAAFDVSERYHTPVIVRPTTRVCHASTFFEVEEETAARPVPSGGFVKDPKWVIFPKRSFEAHGEINERLRRIAEECSTDEVLAAFNPIYDGPTSDSWRPCVGIMAGGVSAAYAREALEMLVDRAAQQGDTVPDFRFMQVGTPYPFPAGAVARFVDGLDEVLVFEELDSVLEEELLAFCGATHGSYTVHGKLTGETLDRGENSVEDCFMRIATFLGLDYAAYAPESRHYAADEPLPARPPVLCAGCPHRGSFYAVKKALGKTPAVLCGDIGCYTLGNAAPLEAVDTCLCMGAGITMAQGFGVADLLAGGADGRKHIAFVGDSTFFASGMTGLANAVYNQHDITVVIVDNSTTAMTGSQPHPGTGVTLMGARHAGISIPKVLRALGFSCITKANPLKLDAAVAAAKEAIAFEGPSAVIFTLPCVQVSSPKKPLVIDTLSCTGCRRCITTIGCPAIGFDRNAKGPASARRGQAYVDANLCNGCGLCTQLCGAQAIVSAREAAAREADASEGAAVASEAAAREADAAREAAAREAAAEIASCVGEGAKAARKGGCAEGGAKAARKGGCDD